MLSPFNDEYFMKQAYQEALKAFEADEVPVGAVIVCKNQALKIIFENKSKKYGYFNSLKNRSKILFTNAP